jgi:hypothetical protein
MSSAPAGRAEALALASDAATEALLRFIREGYPGVPDCEDPDEAAYLREDALEQRAGGIYAGMEQLNPDDAEVAEYIASDIDWAKGMAQTAMLVEANGGGGTEELAAHRAFFGGAEPRRRESHRPPMVTLCASERWRPLRGASREARCGAPRRSGSRRGASARGSPEDPDLPGLTPTAAAPGEAAAAERRYGVQLLAPRARAETGTDGRHTPRAGVVWGLLP